MPISIRTDRTPLISKVDSNPSFISSLSMDSPAEADIYRRELHTNLEDDFLRISRRARDKKKVTPTKKKPFYILEQELEHETRLLEAQRQHDDAVALALMVRRRLKRHLVQLGSRQAILEQQIMAMDQENRDLNMTKTILQREVEQLEAVLNETHFGKVS